MARLPPQATWRTVKMGSSKYSKSVCLPCVAALLGQIYAEVECCLLLRMSGCVRWPMGGDNRGKGKSNGGLPTRGFHFHLFQAWTT